MIITRVGKGRVYAIKKIETTRLCSLFGIVAWGKPRMDNKSPNKR